MSDVKPGHGNSRRKLQALRADEDGGYRERQKREAAARASLGPTEGSPPPAPSRERVARAPAPRGDKALTKGRRITHGRPMA